MDQEIFANELKFSFTKESHFQVLLYYKVKQLEETIFWIWKPNAQNVFCSWLLMTICMHKWKLVKLNGWMCTVCVYGETKSCFVSHLIPIALSFFAPQLLLNNYQVFDIVNKIMYFFHILIIRQQLELVCQNCLLNNKFISYSLIWNLNIYFLSKILIWEFFWEI